MGDLALVADARLLGLIGQIYDCVIEPDRWYGTIDAIREEFSFYNAMMAVHALPRGDAVVKVSVNVTPEHEALALNHPTDVIAMWGGLERVQQMPLEEPMMQSHATDPQTWVDSTYFRGFGMVLGLVDVVGIALARDRRTIATLGFAVHGSRAPVDETDLDRLRLLAPHLRRAITISRLLDLSTQTALNFAAALDASDAGVLLVDDAGRLLHGNARAHAMLQAGDPIRSIHGKVELAAELVNGQFARALAEAGEESLMTRTGLGIPTRTRDNTPLMIHIMPLQSRRVRGGVATAAAAVFIADPDMEPKILFDTLEQLFDLTPAEARVFVLAVEGHNNQGIADIIGTSANTVKTHLTRVFSKTGTHSKADLVRLARHIGSPSPAAVN